MRCENQSTVIVALLGVLLTIAPVEAQRPGGGRGSGRPPDREQLEQRIRAQMGRMMQQRLGLDETQAEDLSEVVQRFETRRQALARSEQAARRRVEALVLDGNGDQEEARELVERIAELRVQDAELFEQEQEALSAVLNPTQVLQLQVLREDLGRRIRVLRDNRPDARRPGRVREPRRGRGR